MKKHFLLVAFTLLLLGCNTSKENNTSNDLTKYVKPNIGTAHSRWFFYTPAALPFGMAKLAPTTNGSYGNPSGWEAVGYDERHTSIEGFSNFREFQIGGVTFMPTVGNLKTVPGKLEDVEGGYRSNFDRKDEFATAGYYSVLLKDYNVKAELTATNRVGFHRYTFPESTQSNIIFDIGRRMGESGPVLDSKVTMIDDTHISGYVTTRPEYVKKYQSGSSVTMYFYAELDKKPDNFGTFNNEVVNAGKKEETGIGAGMYLTYNTQKDDAVNIKVGLSYTSIDNAKLNLETEAKDLTFDQAKENAHKTWNESLGRITVEGKSEDDKIKFYTGLFHAILGRGMSNDANGAYPKNDGTIGQIELNTQGKPKHNHFNTDAIWGGYWNLTLLWAIAYPEHYEDFVQSQLLVYKETGWLGDGLAAGKYVSGVGTNMTGLVIAAAHNIGLKNYDVNLAYEAARKNELEWKGRIPGAGKMDVGAFVQRGFCPYIENNDEGTRELTTEGSGFGTSHTLENCFSTYAVAQFAKNLGKTDDYNQLMQLSKGWEFLYDPSTNFMRPKDINGEFIKDFDPTAPWIGFQEGNAWQYTFYVPHDPEGLIQKIGKDEFNNRLDSIFTISQNYTFGGGQEIDAFAGIKSLYNQGNQPNLHISWLFNYSGRPDLTQKWTRAICNDFYGLDGIHGYGYGQDEDQGQMGAWYVMASIGLFDVKGLSSPDPSFIIGSPLFDKITIKLPQEIRKGEFIIETENNSNQNIYVQKALLNDKEDTTLTLSYESLVKRGTLKLTMGSIPKVKY